MAQVKIKIKSNVSDIFQLSIDDYTILKVNHSYENTITINLSSGNKHNLVFYTEGAEGEKYSIEILTPVHIAPLKGTLDSDGKDFGYIRIDLTEIL